MEYLERLVQEGTIPCLLFSPYPRDAKEIFLEIKSKVAPWFEGTSFELDGGSLFTSSATLFLTDEQKDELLQFTQATPVALYTIASLREAFDAGKRGIFDFAKKDSRSREEDWHRCMAEAGGASAKLSSKEALNDKDLLDLGFAVWTGLNVLLNFAASMSQWLNREITNCLVEEAMQGVVDENAVDWREVHRRTERLIRKAVFSTPYFAELCAAITPLAKILLEQESPEMKQIVYHLFDNCYGLIGHVTQSGDPGTILVMLNHWESFLQSRIRLMTCYFSEVPAVRDSEDSSWECWRHSRGHFSALSPYKWDETFFPELPHKHFWGLNYLGVHGAVGDRAFEILTGLCQLALDEAVSCQQQYAELLYQREGGLTQSFDLMDEQLQQSYRRGLEHVREQKRKKSLELIHGVADSIISGLPWALPNEFSPKPYDPVIYLNRALALLEVALGNENVSVGTAEVARQAGSELAIQLNMWEHLDVISGDPVLKERLRSFFERTEVHLPEGWGDKLQALGLLPKSL